MYEFGKDLEKNFETVITTLYGAEWRKNPNLRETPARIAKAWLEILKYESSTTRREEIKKCTDKVFPTEHEDLIFAPKITAFSMCPHHFLPVKYDICIGYIPKTVYVENGSDVTAYAIGASKLERISRILAARAILQEDLTHEIANILQDNLKTPSVAVITSGHHDCMGVRGIKGKGSFEVSTLRGAFKDNDATRMEFLMLMQKAYSS